MSRFTRILILPILLTILSTAIAKPNSYTRCRHYGNKTNSDESFRLPKSLVPKNYDIEYRDIDFDKKTFKGTAIIWVHVKEKTKNLILHKGKDLNITLTYLNVEENSYRMMDNKDYDFYDEKTELVTFVLDELLPANSSAKIEFGFSGRLLDDMRGFYWSSFFDESGNEQ